MNMTTLHEFDNYRRGESVPAVRLNMSTDFVHITEHEKEFDQRFGLMMQPSYIAGPVVNRLYDYEQLGLEPEEIKRGMQHDHDLIAKLRKENAELRAELARTTCDLQDAEERNNVKDAKIDNLRVEIDGLRNTVNAKDALIRKLVAENLALKATEHIKNDFIRACTVRHIDTFELDKKKLFEENNKLHAEIDELRDKNRELETDLMVARDHANELRKRNAFLTGVYEGGRILKKAHAALNEEYKCVCAENQKLLDKNGSLAKRIGELEKERDGYIKRYKEYEDLYIKSDKLVEEFGKELEDMRAELNHRDKQNEELRKENKRMGNKLSGYRELVRRYQIMKKTVEAVTGCEIDI